jgi:hypothetical protein
MNIRPLDGGMWGGQIYHHLVTRDGDRQRAPVEQADVEREHTPAHQICVRVS